MAPIPSQALSYNSARSLQDLFSSLSTYFTSPSPSSTSHPLSNAKQILRRGLGPSNTSAVALIVSISIVGVLVFIFVFIWVRWSMDREHRRDERRLAYARGQISENGSQIAVVTDAEAAAAANEKN